MLHDISEDEQGLTLVKILACSPTLRTINSMRLDTNDEVQSLSMNLGGLTLCSSSMNLWCSPHAS